MSSKERYGNDTNLGLISGRDLDQDFAAEKTEEESVYANVAESTVDKPEATSGYKCHLFTRWFLLEAACWLILMGIIIVLTCFVVTSFTSDDDTKLTLDKSDHENLSINLQDLTEQLNNLTQAKLVLQDENQKLTKNNQELEAKVKNLTGQIQNMEAETIKFNTSRAQWSINAYCPKDKRTSTCQPCERGWIHSQSSCYGVHNHHPAGRRSWEEAREDCRGKGSDLVVVADDIEKTNITNRYSWSSSGLHGYWIGLRAEHGKWKWVDGSDLAKTSWMTDAATDGRCVISVKNQGWKSVSCDGKQRWICGKAALSV